MSVAMKRPTAGELEYDALRAIESSVRLAAKSLDGMYATRLPAHIEAAIRKLHDAADDIWRRRCAVDEGDARG